MLFARNTVASFFAFGVDMLLLWLFVELGGWDKFAAAALAFLIAITIHYALCRLWVFHGSSRGLAAGYAYFLMNAAAGLLITMGLFAALAELAGLHYLVARVLASIVAGIAVFLLNACLNFRSLPIPGRSGC